jgi:hypothetical protein
MFKRTVVAAMCAAGCASSVSSRWHAGAVPGTLCYTLHSASWLLMLDAARSCLYNPSSHAPASKLGGIPPPGCEDKADKGVVGCCSRPAMSSNCKNTTID